MFRPLRTATALAALTAVALLPATAALASAATVTTVPLTEDGERHYYYDDHDGTWEDGVGGVPVTPGSTLSLPAPPDGAVWETGVELVLRDVPLIEGGLIGDGIKAGMIEADPAVPGGARVVLDAAVTAGSHFTWLQASGPDIEVRYQAELAVGPGAPSDVTLDYATSQNITKTYVTGTSATVPIGSRVTLIGPAGVDLREFSLRVYPGDPEIYVRDHSADQLAVENSADGSSVTFTVPSILPPDFDGTPRTQPLPAGSKLVPVLMDYRGNHHTVYEVVDLTVSPAVSPTAAPATTAPATATSATATATTATTATTTATTTKATTTAATPRVPTAVPAGAEPVSGSGSAGALWTAAIVGVALTALVTTATVAARRGIPRARR